MVQTRSKKHSISTPATPKTTKKRVKMAPKSDKKPIKKSCDPSFAKAKQQLQTLAETGILPCREEQFQEIYDSVESALTSETGSCIYVSGVPGTGKTATVKNVVRALNALVKKRELVPFDFIEINGMETVDPAKVYTILCQKLLDKKVTGPQAATLLEKHFTSTSKKKRMCLLLVDELDQFMTKTQKVLYNFFDWPNRPGSNLVAIAIANTMDLPERAMLNRISSRIGLSRINFEPYTHQQLNEIIRFRLDGLDIFEDNALEMCARKVSAISGDARRALDICRHAIDIQQKSSTFEKINMSIVTRAIKELFSSPTLLKLQNASFEQQLCLASILKRIKLTGIGEVELLDVFHEYHLLSGIVTLNATLNVSDFIKTCWIMAHCRWILSEPGQFHIRKKLRLNIMEEDVLYCLKNSQYKDIQRLV